MVTQLMIPVSNSESVAQLQGAVLRGLAAIFIGYAAFFFGRTVLGLAFALIGRVPGVLGSQSQRLARAVTPRLIRRLVIGAASVGFGVATPLAPALAASQGTPSRLPDLDRVPSYSLATETQPGHRQAKPAPMLPPRAAAIVEAAPTHTVKAGESLWSIANDYLAETANRPKTSIRDVQVAKEWPRWWQANRAKIGTEPSALAVGLRLISPHGVPAGLRTSEHSVPEKPQPLPSATRPTGVPK